MPKRLQLPSGPLPSLRTPAHFGHSVIFEIIEDLLQMQERRNEPYPIFSLDGNANAATECSSSSEIKDMDSTPAMFLILWRSKT